MGYRSHIVKCIRERTFFRKHVDGALDELREKYRKAKQFDDFQAELQRFNVNPKMTDRQFITHLHNLYEED